MCGEGYDVRLVSFGDVRGEKMVYGESPISKTFGVCMFDYVYAFVVKSETNAQKVPNFHNKN